jgi:hypothetical protein
MTTHGYSSSDSVDTLTSPFAETYDETAWQPVATAQPEVFTCCAAHSNAAQHEDFEYFNEDFANGDNEYDEYEAETEMFDVEAETFPSGLVLSPVSLPTGPTDEHHDPNGVNLPLYDTNASLHAKPLSKNFTVGELVTSGGRRSPAARISVDLVRCLQALRDHVAVPITVTSGYRSFNYNRKLYEGRKKTPTKSRHSSGQAVDIKIRGMTGLEIAKTAIDVCGPNIGVGIGGDFAHVDVRGTWARWTYLGKGSAKERAAIQAIERHRAARVKGAPPPAKKKAAVAPSTDRRMVVDRHPLLRSHAGRSPDLILRWNRLPDDGVIDVVVHFHGFSTSKRRMHLSEKERMSGLDFADPAAPSTTGRTAPTLTILPRGSNNSRQGGNGYDFHALARPGAVAELIADSLARVGAATGRTLRRGRLIITAHSGGGRALISAVGQLDPDEVHVFDALYGTPDPAKGTDPIRPLVDWARRRIARSPGSAALRVVYLGTTSSNSQRLAAHLCRELASAPDAHRRRFRVERSAPGVDHNRIPRAFGWRLLADAGADLPGVAAIGCSAPTREAEFEQWAGVDEAELDESFFDEADIGEDEFEAFESFDSEDFGEEDCDSEDVDSEDVDSEMEEAAGHPRGVPKVALGTLSVDAPGRPTFRYRFTTEDLIWTAKLIVHEAGGDDDPENAAVLWAMFNRYALFTHRHYPSFAAFIRRYSTTLQPVLASRGAAERHYRKGDTVYRRTGGFYPGSDIPKGQLIRHLRIQAAPWAKVKASARQLALRALRGEVPNPGIGLASEFASTWVYYVQHNKSKPTRQQWLDYTNRFARRKKWRFVGDVSRIDPTKNAFFVQQRVAELPPGSVTVVAPGSSGYALEELDESFDETLDDEWFEGEWDEAMSENESLDDAAFGEDEDGEDEFTEPSYEWESPMC